MIWMFSLKKYFAGAFFLIFFCSSIPALPANLFLKKSDKNKENSSAGQSAVSSSWCALRNFLSREGIDIGLDYTADILRLPSVNNGQTDFIGLFNFDVQFDLNTLLNLNNTILYVNGFASHGPIPGAEVGMAQGISSIAAYNTWSLFQCWLQSNFYNDRLSILIGLLDLNSEFDNREASSLFINPSQGIGVDFSQSGLNGPSIYPVSSLTFRIKYQANSGFYSQAAVFDAVPGDLNSPGGTSVILNKKEGALLVSETGWQREGEDKAAAGLWYYTSTFDEINHTAINGEIKKGNYGVYLFGEKSFKLPVISSISRGACYLRLGYANPYVNQFDVYLGGGFVINALLAASDEIGIAFGMGHNGNPFQDQMLAEGNQVAGAETDIELTYRFNLLPLLSLQPDIQFCINPSENKASKSLIVFGFRTQVAF